MQESREYELILVIHPEEDEGGLEELTQWVGEVIVGSGGQVEAVDTWGKRRLAYPIEKSIEGHYVLMRVQHPTQGLGELERNLKLQQRVLRYLLVRKN